MSFIQIYEDSSGSIGEGRIRETNVREISDKKITSKPYIIRCLLVIDLLRAAIILLHPRWSCHPARSAPDRRTDGLPDRIHVR